MTQCRTFLFFRVGPAHTLSSPIITYLKVNTIHHIVAGCDTLHVPWNMERGNVILPDLIWQSREVSHAIKSGEKDIMKVKQLLKILKSMKGEQEIIFYTLTHYDLSERTLETILDVDGRCEITIEVNDD